VLGVFEHLPEERVTSWLPCAFDRPSK